jgi:hypothetical protein
MGRPRPSGGCEWAFSPSRAVGAPGLAEAPAQIGAGSQQAALPGPQRLRVCQAAGVLRGELRRAQVVVRGLRELALALQRDAQVLVGVVPHWQGLDGVVAQRLGLDVCGSGSRSPSPGSSKLPLSSHASTSRSSRASTCAKRGSLAGYLSGARGRPGISLRGGVVPHSTIAHLRVRSGHGRPGSTTQPRGARGRSPQPGESGARSRPLRGCPGHPAAEDPCTSSWTTAWRT